MQTVPGKEEHKNILLIEEHPFVRDALDSALQAFGHSVVALESAEAGWDALSKETFDVIVCNQHLPGASGMEFFEKTRKTVPNALAILTAGFADNYLVNDSLSMGIDVFMEKPFKIEDLSACIQGRFPEIGGSSLDGCHYITNGGQVIAVSCDPEQESTRSRRVIEMPIERGGRHWKLYINLDKPESSLMSEAAGIDPVRQGI